MRRGLRAACGSWGEPAGADVEAGFCSFLDRMPKSGIMGPSCPRLRQSLVSPHLGNTQERQDGIPADGHTRFIATCRRHLKPMASICCGASREDTPGRSTILTRGQQTLEEKDGRTPFCAPDNRGISQDGMDGARLRFAQGEDVRIRRGWTARCLRGENLFAASRKGHIRHESMFEITGRWLLAADEGM